MEQTDSNIDQNSHAVNETARKPYNSPALVQYGNVAKLTQSTGSRNGDGGQNMKPD